MQALNIQFGYLFFCVMFIYLYKISPRKPNKQPDEGFLKSLADLGFTEQTMDNICENDFMSFESAASSGRAQGNMGQILQDLTQGAVSPMAHCQTSQTIRCTFEVGTAV